MYILFFSFFLVIIYRQATLIRLNEKKKDIYKQKPKRILNTLKWERHKVKDLLI